MSTETEIKVRIDSPDSFCRKLDVFNPKVLSGRHFEDNYLLDFPDGRLRSNQCLVRIRYAEGQSIITYKGPPRAEGIFKTREELETRLENGVIAYRILEQLGLCLWFRYQKYRQEFQLDEVVVSVDETPAGNYAEFEGSEERIETLARKMGIDRSQFIRSSYYALFMEQCQKRGITAGHMIF